MTAVLDQLATLADATRARLLLALEEQELAVGDLCAVLQLPQSTVSRHLKILGDEGWVASRAEGTSRRYRMAALDDPTRDLWQVVRREVRLTPEAAHDATRLGAVLAERRMRSRDFFAAGVTEWDSIRTELFGTRAELAALPALLDPRWVVADLGCGTGQLSAALAPFVERVIAVDENPGMLEAARLRLGFTPRVELRAGTLEALPIETATADAAVLALVLHHAPEPAAVIREAARILRPGGRLLVLDMVPHGRDDYRQQMGHAWLGFDAERLAAWCDAAGLVMERHVALPADPAARGPNLFVATAQRRGTHNPKELHDGNVGPDRA